MIQSISFLRRFLSILFFFFPFSPLASPSGFVRRRENASINSLCTFDGRCCQVHQIGRGTAREKDRQASTENLIQEDTLFARLSDDKQASFPPSSRVVGLSGSSSFLPSYSLDTGTHQINKSTSDRTCKHDTLQTSTLLTHTSPPTTHSRSKD